MRPGSATSDFTRSLITAHSLAARVDGLIVFAVREVGVPATD